MTRASPRRLSATARLTQLVAIVITCIFAMLIVARKVGAAPAPDPGGAPHHSILSRPRPDGPAKAKVGLVLVGVDGYDVKTGTFAADFFLSLTADRPMGAIELAFRNGIHAKTIALADTPTFKLYRCRADLVSPVDLRAYPFDSQSLSIEVEDERAGVDQIVFVPDASRTALDESFDVAGWRVGRIGAKAYRHEYPPRFDQDDLYLSRYQFKVQLDRHGSSAAFGVYVPAFIIVLISLFGLWVHPDHLTVRTNAGAPMLAAAVLFHYSLLQTLPQTGYFTRADKLMLSVYASIALTIAMSLVLLVVDGSKMDRYFRLGRVVIPVAVVLIMIAGSAG